MRQSLGQRQQQEEQQQEHYDYEDDGADSKMSKKSAKLEPKSGLEQDTNNNNNNNGNINGKRKSSQVQLTTNGSTTSNGRKRERRGENVPNDGQQQPMTQQQQQSQAQLGAGKQEENVCAACGKPIRERYLLVALDKRWHEDCLKCACCDCRLGEVGSSLFTHSDKILCRRDFLRIFGQHGHCATCKKSIPPYELVMRAGDNAYHIDCFACQQCQYRFCVGDQFQLDEHQRIVCIGCHLHDHHHKPSIQQQQQQPFGQLQMELTSSSQPEAAKQVPPPAAELAAEVPSVSKQAV